MKKNIFLCLISAFFVLLLCFPKEALEGSTNGLLLWFHTVLPSLLPFIILTGLIIRLDAVPLLCRFMLPVCSRAFSIGPYGCYALITGFLCGYPMGAKTIAQLLREGKLSPEEGNYLLGICNNASPMFFIGYVITQSLNCGSHKIPLLLILYGTPLLYAYFTKPTGNCAQKSTVPSGKFNQTHLTFRMVDESIMDGFETITRLGGYIILFAMIAKMATARLNTVTILNHLLIGIIEITNGIHSIGASNLPLSWQIPISMAIVTLGGLSGLAQTKSMIQGTKLSLSHYLITKLKLTLLCTLLAALYSYLFVA